MSPDCKLRPRIETSLPIKNSATQYCIARDAVTSRRIVERKASPGRMSTSGRRAGGIAVLPLFQIPPPLPIWNNLFLFFDFFFRTDALDSSRMGRSTLSGTVREPIWTHASHRSTPTGTIKTRHRQNHLILGLSRGNRPLGFEYSTHKPRSGLGTDAAAPAPGSGTMATR